MPRPGRKPQKQAKGPSSENNLMGWAVIVLAAVAIYGAFFRDGFRDRKPPQPIDDQQKQVIDDQKKEETKPAPAPSPKVDLKSCILMAVFDAKSSSSDPGYRETLQDDEFWRAYASSVCKDVEFFEDDDDAGKKVLAGAQAPAPMVALFNQETRKFVWVMPLPKNGTDEIKKRLEQ